MIGKRFHHLLITAELPRVRYPSTSMRNYLCLCDCGKEIQALHANLMRGATKSCGCWKVESAGRQFLKHGMSQSSEYGIYVGMKKRCYKETYIEFHLYGGKGIKVCDRWLQSFENFYADMGNRPSPLHSIDRIDSMLGYSKENCRWATKREQTINRKNSVFVEYKNERVHLSDFAKKIGAKYSSAYNCIVRKGLTVDEALKRLISS